MGQAGVEDRSLSIYTHSDGDLTMGISMPALLDTNRRFLIVIPS
jgi:hypothetical protein